MKKKGDGYHKENIFDRIKKRYSIKETGCWEWNNVTASHGYGNIHFEGKPFLAHRLMFLLYKGEIPKNMDICHSCDNKKCVNPDHLWLGTHYENMMDNIKKGRGNKQKGIECHKSKLKEEDVLEIRKLYNKGGFSVIVLAKIFGVTHQNIYNIIIRKIWKHI